MNAACLRPNLGKIPTFLTAVSLAKFLTPYYLYISAFQTKLFNTRVWHCAMAFDSLSSQSLQLFRGLCPNNFYFSFLRNIVFYTTILLRYFRQIKFLDNTVSVPERCQSDSIRH